MKVIQIIQKSTGEVHTTISSLEELYKFFQEQAYHDAYQRRTAVESLLTSHNNSGNSMDRNWLAKVVEEIPKRKRRK